MLVFGQSVGSVLTQHRKNFGCLLNCSSNSGLGNQQRLGIRLADYTSPLNWWMIVHILLHTSVVEASSRLAGPGPHWSVSPGVTITYRPVFIHVAFR